MSTIGYKTLMSLFDLWREHLLLVLNSANEKPLILTISEAMSTIGHKTRVLLTLQIKSRYLVEPNRTCCFPYFE